MKKKRRTEKLVTKRTEKKDKYFNVIGDQCGDEEGAEWSSKHYLLRQSMRQVNIVLDETGRNFVATYILELEKLGVLEVDWKSLLEKDD